MEKNSKYEFDLGKNTDPRREESVLPVASGGGAEPTPPLPTTSRSLMASFWTLAILVAGALVSPLNYNDHKRKWEVVKRDAV